MTVTTKRHAHAAHDLFSGKPVDLETYTVTSPTMPTRDQLRAAGVPVEAHYQCGMYAMGVQTWDFCRQLPATVDNCERCKVAA